MAKHESDEIKETVISGGPMFPDRVRRSIPIVPENRQAIDDFVRNHNEKWNRFCDIDSRLAEVENELEVIIAAGGRSEFDERRLRDAREGIIQLKLIKSYRQSGETGAVESGLMGLGMILERLHVRQFENDVSTGIKRKEQVSRLNDEKYGPQVERERLGAEIVREVNELGKSYAAQGCKRWVSRACQKLHEEGKFHGLSAEDICGKYNYWKKR